MTINSQFATGQFAIANAAVRVGMVAAVACESGEGVDIMALEGWDD